MVNVYQESRNKRNDTTGNRTVVIINNAADRYRGYEMISRFNFSLLGLTVNNPSLCNEGFFKGAALKMLITF